MTKDEELWACALYVLERYGDQVHAFITGRIEDLTGHGDAAGLKVDSMVDVIGCPDEDPSIVLLGSGPNNRLSKASRL